jgi:hypothetical protein
VLAAFILSPAKRKYVPDSQGRFSITRLKAGSTRLNAFKEDAFCPNAHFGLWDGEGSAEVGVAAGDDLAGILLKLKPVARIEIQPVDVITSEPICSITVRFERGESPRHYVLGTNGSNTWLIPTAPIRFQVQTGGYEPTWYGADYSMGG